MEIAVTLSFDPSAASAEIVSLEFDDLSGSLPDPGESPRILWMGELIFRGGEPVPSAAVTIRPGPVSDRTNNQGEFELETGFSESAHSIEVQYNGIRISTLAGPFPRTGNIRVRVRLELVNVPRPGPGGGGASSDAELNVDSISVQNEP